MKRFWQKWLKTIQYNGYKDEFQGKMSQILKWKREFVTGVVLSKSQDDPVVPGSL